MPDLLFSTNSIAGSPQGAKEISHGGRRYLVSPVVALREGVLNGVYVSAAEFSKYAAAWAGRACPIGHPKNEGGYISANSPDVWANDVPGHLWNVEVDGDKLKGEIWIDLEKAQGMGERALGIVNRLRANQPVEVSTGYFADHDSVGGVWNGQPYLGVARNIRPDHLALLPDEVGACSWADGCGTPRVNSEEGPSMVDVLRTDFDVLSRGGHGDNTSKTEEAGLFERFLGWFRQHKEIEIISNESALSQSHASLRGVKEGAEEIQQESDMNKDQLITALVANCKCKFSKDKLQTWDEADLQVLQESLTTNEEEAAAPAADVTPMVTPTTALPTEITQFAEMIRGLGGLDKLAAALGGVTANADRERADLIASIVANTKATWSETELRGFDTPTLHKLHGLSLPRDYSGNGGYVRTHAPEEEPMPMPWPDEFKKMGV